MASISYSWERLMPAKTPFLCKSYATLSAESRSRAATPTPDDSNVSQWLTCRCGAASQSLLPCPVQTYFGLLLNSDRRLLVRKESGDFFKRPLRRLENDLGVQLILLSWESHDDLRHFVDESAGVPGTVPFLRGICLSCVRQGRIWSISVRLSVLDCRKPLDSTPSLFRNYQES